MIKKYVSHFFLTLSAEYVGADEFGNRYYRKIKKSGERRLVIYAGTAEASKVPPQWYGWLHHMSSELPSEKRNLFFWQKPHRPNFTGTELAYRPNGHLLAGGKRQHSGSDYQAWSPSQSVEDGN